MSGYWLLGSGEAADIESALDEYAAEELRHRLYVADRLRETAWLDVPASLADLSPKDIYELYVIGNVPFPDLAAAEYVRSELQHLLSQWTRAMHAAAGAALSDAAAMAARKREANLRRGVIMFLAQGDIGQRGLVKKIAATLARDPARAARLGFETDEKDVVRFYESNVRQLLKDMKRAPGFVLTTADRELINSALAFELSDVIAEDF